MGTVQSIDSCSSRTCEARKDSLFTIPAEEGRTTYDDSRHDTSIQNHQTLVAKVVPDSESSREHSLGVTVNERPSRVTRSGVISGRYVDSKSPSRSSVSPNRREKGAHNSSRLTGSVSKAASHRHISIRGVRKATSKALAKVSHAATSVGHGSKRLLFPHHQLQQPHPQQNGSSSISPREKSRHRIKPTPQVSSRVRGGVLLRGCSTDDEHRQVVREILEALRPLHGRDGLEACGFEYRLVHPNDDGRDAAPTTTSTNTGSTGRDDLSDFIEEATEADGSRHSSHTVRDRPIAQDATPDIGSNNGRYDCCTDSMKNNTRNVDGNARPLKPSGEACALDCNQHATTTTTRLFHIDSGTMITERNRKEFIADGDMYDAVARLAMEYAQEVMIRDGQIEWVTIAEAGNNSEPIRALVSTRVAEDNNQLDTDPTLLIATGKGKVRAGIFSRQHLLLSGLECSTAVPLVREARKRKMNILILDPNVHGDRLGMVTFEKSMAHLFRRWEEREDGLTMPRKPHLSPKDLYVLSHSQSGAQFARYLLDKAEFYLPHIRAVAFTDSTHNVQWAKKKEGLRNLLESDNCVYFKCAKKSNGTELKSLPSVGEAVDTDEFWKHRFGNIKTLCAGTSEHSLTNWFARHHIWNHFDRYLAGSKSPVSNEIRDDHPVADTVEMSDRTLDPDDGSYIEERTRG